MNHPENLNRWYEEQSRRIAKSYKLNKETGKLDETVVYFTEGPLTDRRRTPFPAGGLYYGSYEFFKKNTLKNEFLSQHAFLAYLMGGIFAETISCIIFVPVDVIKERR